MPTQKMKVFRSQPPVRLVLALIVAVASVSLFAHFRAKQRDTGHRPVVSFATAKPVLEALVNELPPQLKEPNEGKWKALGSTWGWCRSCASRARRTRLQDSNDALVQSRLDDLLRSLRNPGKNERLIFLQDVLRRRGTDPDSSAGYEKTKTFVLENLRRVVQEQATFQEQFNEATHENDQEAGLSKRSHLFRDRGISLDTTILSSSGSRARCAIWRAGQCFQRSRLLAWR